MSTVRNHIKVSEHFSLHEFENDDGLCCVHPSVLESLERLHLDLCAKYGESCISITDAIRTPEDNARLGKLLGYTDQPGGLVARDSMHLLKHNGVAVDIHAHICGAKGIPQKELGYLARHYFDYVKDDYKDGHVHCDNRSKQNG